MDDRGPLLKRFPDEGGVLHCIASDRVRLKRYRGYRIIDQIGFESPHARLQRLKALNSVSAEASRSASELLRFALAGRPRFQLARRDAKLVLINLPRAANERSTTLAVNDGGTTETVATVACLETIANVAANT